MNVVPVPGEEVPSAVNGHCVLHMNGDKVVETGFGAGVLCGGEFGGRFGDALDGGDVGFLFCGGDVAPKSHVRVVDGDGGWGESIPFSSNPQLLLGTCC